MSALVPQEKAAPLVERFKAAIGKQVTDVLPKHVALDRFMRSLAFAVSQNDTLFRIAQQDIARVAVPAMKAAELGLVISGALGEAYLIPYKDEVQMIPGYKGLISLARRGGDIKQMVANVVYKGEEFSYDESRECPVHHVQDFDAETEGEWRFPYAIATFNGGGQQAKVVPKWKCRKIMNASLSRLKDWQKAKSPWTTETAEMLKKTAIRALFKYLPVSTEQLQHALDIDNDNARRRGEMIDAEAELLPADNPDSEPEAPTGTAAQVAELKAQLKAGAAKKEEA